MNGELLCSVIIYCAADSQLSIFNSQLLTILFPFLRLLSDNRLHG